MVPEGSVVVLVVFLRCTGWLYEVLELVLVVVLLVVVLGGFGWINKVLVVVLRVSGWL